MEKYIYYRDDQNRPVVTECLMKHGNRYARGIAICSPRDNPCKKVGRAIAKTRAQYACTRIMGDLPILRDDATEVMDNLGLVNIWKATCVGSTELTFKERHVLGV